MSGVIIATATVDSNTSQTNYFDAAIIAHQPFKPVLKV